MYYYQIQDVNGQIIEDSPVGYNTGDDAMNAAKDQLITMYLPNYPVEIRISDGRFFQGQEQFSSTHYMDAGMVSEHWKDKIEKANRKELTDIVQVALKRHEQLMEQYTRGLLTPLDLARDEEGSWINTRYTIEGKTKL